MPSQPLKWIYWQDRRVLHTWFSSNFILSPCKTTPQSLCKHFWVTNNLISFFSAELLSLCWLFPHANTYKYEYQFQLPRNCHSTAEKFKACHFRAHICWTLEKSHPCLLIHYRKSLGILCWNLLVVVCNKLCVKFVPSDYNISLALHLSDFEWTCFWDISRNSLEVSRNKKG